MSEHTSLPTRLPDVTHLSNDELQALRHKVGSLSREARRKSNSLITRSPELKDPWMRSISVKTDDPDRAEVLATFERVLLRYPEAYLAYAYVTSLFVLDDAFRAEMIRRSMLPVLPKKRGSLPPPEPRVEPAPASRAPWEVEDDSGP